RHRAPCPPPGAPIAPPAAEVKRAVRADEAKIGQGLRELPILSTREPRRREVLQRLWRAPRGADHHPRAALLHAAASRREDSCVPERAQGRAQAGHGPLRRRRARWSSRSASIPRNGIACSIACSGSLRAAFTDTREPSTSTPATASWRSS